jgi:AcrR family transcriptional regulator
VQESGGKGAATREAVLDEAVRIAGEIGLSGLTIGMLATSTGLSKSGLFAHFGSKEALQLQVLAKARDEFTDRVVRPALRAPRGWPRMRALFYNWLDCGRDGGAPCLFASAAMEYDDQDGKVREQVVRDHRDLADTVEQIYRTGVAEGHFRADFSPAQFYFELVGIMLAFLHTYRLLGDESSDQRAIEAFHRLLDAVSLASDSQPPVMTQSGP